MFNGLNFSVYLSEANKQLPLLEAELSKGSFVFTSFHIGEEVDKDYCADAINLCRRLTADGYRIMADVSGRTLDIFGVDSLKQFARQMDITLLRIDYGFTDEELVDMAEDGSIVVNCSTLGREAALRLGKAGNAVYGLHNFYPRPETGLDSLSFDRMNDFMRSAGIEPMAFIPGDTLLRGPLGEGLPTLEAHRGMPPYAAYLDMTITHGVKGVFVGDGIVTDEQYRMICDYERTGVIMLPTLLDEAHADLYDRIFTVRVDSPASIARFAESREYSAATAGLCIEPRSTKPRHRGCITIDNMNYGRYQGEVQLVRTALPADTRVNVIGELSPKYISLLSTLQNGMRFVLKR